MKKLNFLPPPDRKTHYNVSLQNWHRILKKNACISSLAVCLILTSCTSASAEPETNEQNTASQISAFNEYSWETSYDEIKSSEITGDMKEQIDYIEEEIENGMVALSIQNQKISGYDTSIGYAFSDDMLVAGSYDMGGVDEESYDLLLKKFSSKYGDPFLTKDSTGWGRLAVWVDNSQNILCLSEILDVLYMENESPFLDFINDQFIEFHEVDLISSLSMEGL